MLLKTILLLTVAACVAVPSSIVRPCSSNACVARFLASQSMCNPYVRGSVPSEYKIRRLRYDTPYFNSTNIDNDLIIKNHDKCFISEFYVNLHTHWLVLALDCPGLEFQSTRTVIQHHSLREDSVYHYTYQGHYPLIRMTITMLLTPPLDLCHAFTFADVTALPTYRVSPNDNKTAKFLSKDDTYLNIYERETFHYRGSTLARFYTNSMLCDFGCNF